MTDVQTPAEGEDELRDELPAEVRAVMAANPEYSIAQAIDAAIAAQEADPDVGEVADQKVLQLLKQAKAAHEADEAQDRSARPKRKERRRAVPLMPEVRHWQASGLEIRSNTTTDEIVISGTPIVYGADYEVHDMFGAFTERMAPGVASEVLERGADVRFLFNHDGLPLARTTSGTMTLTDTPTGLDFEARLDARQQLANDLAIAVERGDCNQMSCGFIVARDEWDEAMEDRTVLRFADLLDVSGVTYPASPTTSLQIAKRMALEMPVESRARARKLYVDLRAGKVLSQGNQDKLVAAASALHSVLDAAGFDSEPDEPESDGAPDVDPGEQIRTDDEHKTKTSRALEMEIETARKRRKVA